MHRCLAPSAARHADSAVRASARRQTLYFRRAATSASLRNCRMSADRLSRRCARVGTVKSGALALQSESPNWWVAVPRHRGLRRLLQRGELVMKVPQLTSRKRRPEKSDARTEPNRFKAPCALREPACGLLSLRLLAGGGAQLPLRHHTGQDGHAGGRSAWLCRPPSGRGAHRRASSARPCAGPRARLCQPA